MLGWSAWLIAGYALWAKRTRPVAVVLWLSMLAWVSNRGPQRPSALAKRALHHARSGVAVDVGGARAGGRLQPTRARSRAHVRASRVRGAVVGVVHLAGNYLAFREQLWFFGRASRNIYDQHVRTGRKLRDEFRPQPQRVLVGDAGAIPYISDLPALDIIGSAAFAACRSRAPPAKT